jgi:histidine triad (HIT) family protein
LPSPHDDCLFCGIVRDGAYVAQTKGFVAINDIHPQAAVHLLIIPEHHVDSFREVGEFSARESKRMLEFVADTAREVGLTDYRVQVNVGPAAGQTVFHLHWHVLGEPAPEGHGVEMTTAVSEL